MFFFKKKKYKPELLSLHIPKTAGTSFRNILKSVYGKNAVIRFDINNKGVTLLNEMIYHSDKLPSAKVIHGHFVFKDISERFELPEDIKKITWLRHPVKRVISNYTYLEARLTSFLKEEKRGLNILNKMQRTLLEYARDEMNRNRQHKFLEGIELHQFDFIGITEDFETDLAQAAKILEWPDNPLPLHQNKTPFKKPELPAYILKEIEELNSKDMELYREALRMREKKLTI
jgi:hypothetical protein